MDPFTWSDYAFPKGVSAKVDIIALLEFELIYFEAVVMYIN